MIKFEQMIQEASQSIGAKRVFGEPYEKNGVTIIPAARVMGGVGGGGGTAPESVETDTEHPQPAGQTGVGAGYGMSGRPAGAFVIKGDDVSWLPAVDINRLVFGFQVVAIVFFLVMRSVLKARAQGPKR